MRRRGCPPSIIDIVELFPLFQSVPTNLPTKLGAEEKKRKRNIFSGSLCFSFCFRSLGPVLPPPARGGGGIDVSIASSIQPRRSSFLRRDPFCGDGVENSTHSPPDSGSRSGRI